MIREFALPDLGEGLTESELVEWHVAVGDTVTLNQPIAEVETAKAIVQLPSPFAGVVSKLYVEPGTTVSVGTAILAIEVSSDQAVPERNAVLVGYGPAVESGARPHRKTRRVAPEKVVPRLPVADAAPAENGTRASKTALGEIRVMPMSTPPVRKLAHDLGVNLAGIAGTGEGGTITREDVQSAAGQLSAPVTVPSPATVPPAATARTPVVASAEGSGERRTPIKGVRKHTAAAMVASAFTAPHVTEFLTVDVTRTVDLVSRLKARGELVSVLGVISQAVCLAVSRNPSINSRWDEPAGEIVEFDYVNLGIAVATPRGLMVPNIPNAGGLGLLALTAAIAELAQAARSGTITPAALSGGTFTISNVGVFGVDSGTPIINPGEAAILATGAVRRIPWEHERGIALREMMTLSLSFDHRLVDGEQGARFLVDVGNILSDPGSVMLLV